MKCLALAAIIALSVNGVAVADVSDLDDYLLWNPDLMHIHVFQAPGPRGMTNNQQQEDDLLYGYRDTVAAEFEAPVMGQDHVI